MFNRIFKYSSIKLKVYYVSMPFTLTYFAVFYDLELHCLKKKKKRSSFSLIFAKHLAATKFKENLVLRFKSCMALMTVNAP